METATTDPTAERALVTGGDPDAPFRVPIFSGDFRDAPELARIGNALIQTCEEFEDLKWAIEEDGFEIAYVWKKKASKSADKFVAGKQGKPGGLAKHFATEAKGAPVGYTVVLAADANYGQTNWQIEARVFHELYHCKIGRKIVGKGEDRHTVPVLKVRGHDLEMFWAERQRYGDWHAALEKGSEVFAQSRLPMAPGGHPPAKPKDAPNGNGVSSVTLSTRNRSVTLTRTRQEIGEDIARHAAKGGEAPLRFDAEGTVLPADWPDDDLDSAGEAEARLVDGDLTAEQHVELIRAEFGTKVNMGGTEVCKRCLIPAAEHPLDHCGETVQAHQEKSPQNRGKANGATPKGGSPNGADVVLGQMGASNGKNGSHDPGIGDAFRSGDDFDGPNRDPEKTAETLRQAGRQIVWEGGQFRHPSRLPVYSASWVEGELRALKTGAAS